MNDKGAIKRLNELLKCTNLLSDTDHESMRVAIKALEVVEKIKKAWRDEKYPEYFEEAVGEILKDAYKDWDASKVDRESTFGESFDGKYKRGENGT